MKKMLRPIFVIIILTILTLLCSCGTFKKTVTKNKEEEKKVIDTETVSTTTVTEKANTNITIAADTSLGSKDLEEIVEGDSLVMETNETKTVVKFNKKTKQINASTIQKEKNIPVVIDKTTVTNSTVKKHETVITKTESKNKNVSRTGLPWYFWWLLWIIIILLIAFFIWRKIFKKTIPL